MIGDSALAFYNNNKDLTWNLPPIPADLVTDLEIATWIMNNNNIGWLELDIEIDINKWKEECQVTNDYFVDHRGQEHPGWNSCCIHGIDVDKTGSWNTYGYATEDQVPYNWTSLSNSTPTIKQFWNKEFPVEKYRRIRFMELEAGGYISPHSDAPGNLAGEHADINILDHGAPVNIAIIHPKDCHMIVEGFGVVPWEEGKAFMVNIRNYHSVINFSNQQRIHMIGHGWYGTRTAEFCRLVVKSYMKQYKNT